MAKKRPVKRLKKEYKSGSGKAQVLGGPGQLSHLLFVASRGDLGSRNVAILASLFGSALRINEIAKLKVSDVYYKDGQLKYNFIIPGSYTKTGNPRMAYIMAKVQRQALERWRQQRLDENAFLSDDGSYGGLEGSSPLFLSKKGSWRKFSFNYKKYKLKDGTIAETLVCASLENTIREIFKSSGFEGGSSHSGRRTLATWADRKDVDLDLIQLLLGHLDPEMSLIYIDPSEERIKKAYQNSWKGLRLPDFNDGIALEAV
jgi:integrase